MIPSHSLHTAEGQLAGWIELDGHCIRCVFGWMDAERGVDREKMDVRSDEDDERKSNVK